MTLLERLGRDLPRSYYSSVDVGYKEHVGGVIPLEVFLRDDGRWKRARCVHFPSTRARLRILQSYLDGFPTDPTELSGPCEPTGGYHGAAVFRYLLDRGYDMNWIEIAMTAHMREEIFLGTPRNDAKKIRAAARIGWLHATEGEEFTIRPMELPEVDNADLLALCWDSWKP